RVVAQRRVGSSRDTDRRLSAVPGCFSNGRRERGKPAGEVREEVPGQERPCSARRASRHRGGSLSSRLAQHRVEACRVPWLRQGGVGGIAGMAVTRGSPCRVASDSWLALPSGPRFARDLRPGEEVQLVLRDGTVGTATVVAVEVETPTRCWSL